MNSHESAMRKPDLEAMEVDELWLIHEELTKLLSEKIAAEKSELEKRLAKLNQVEKFGEVRDRTRSSKTSRGPRRRYPKVLPKYSNPLSPTETWSGRGKQPRWLVAALKIGRKLEEFEISDIERDKMATARGQHT